MVRMNGRQWAVGSRVKGLGGS